MTMLRRRIITAEEQDVHTGWRRVMCRFNRAGNAAKAKRSTNQRERREGKRECWEGRKEWHIGQAGHVEIRWYTEDSGR